MEELAAIDNQRNDVNLNHFERDLVEENGEKGKRIVKDILGFLQKNIIISAIITTNRCVICTIDEESMKMESIAIGSHPHQFFSNSSV